MSATAKEISPSIAQVLSQKSALSRRRTQATYMVRAESYGGKSAAWLTAMAALFVIAFIVKSSAPRPVESRNRAWPLTQPTQAQQLDRFALSHRVQRGDTISALAARYYGSSSVANQRRLLDANPGLPIDLRQMTVDTLIKVPLI